MYFYRHLYTGPSIRDPEEVKNRLRKGQETRNIYVIALSPGESGPGSNQLEFYNGTILKQPYYSLHPPFIIGIARGRREATELVRQIVQEAYEHTGSGDVRAYLFPHGIVTGRTSGSGDQEV